MLNAVVQMAAVQLELCLTGAAAGTPAAPADVVLIVRSGAEVQDVATVLAALQAARKSA